MSKTQDSSAAYNILAFVFKGQKGASDAMKQLKSSGALDGYKIEAECIVEQDTKGKVHMHETGRGGVGTAIGLGLTLNSPKQRNEDKGWELISTRPPGAALLAIGGVTLVTGVALFIVDRQRRQQRRSALTPVVGPGVAGVSWAGRF